jgi:hypothetical protein
MRRLQRFQQRFHGVRRFATRNVRDFEGIGFDEVWDPTGS